MAQTIKIKRSSSTAAPTSLGAGELAYSSNSKKLFVGHPSSSAVTTIGGDLFVEMLDHTAGTLTASSAIVVDTSSKIDQLKTGNIVVTGSNITVNQNACSFNSSETDYSSGTIEEDYKTFNDNLGNIRKDDKKTGHIYILSSLSLNKDIQNMKYLYKIGYCKTSVEERIENAENETTFLMAPVKIVSSYKTFNLNPQKFEDLICTQRCIFRVK